MTTVRMTVFARTDVGRVRSNNEDSFAVTDLDTGAEIEGAAAPAEVDVQRRGILMVVSDGMGGHAAGEVASALVVDSLRKSLNEPGTDTSSIQRLVTAAVHRANADVWKLAHATRKDGMGATLTAVLVHRTDAYVAQVGDSRAYLLRAGRIRQITKDQSFVQLLVDAGVLTREEAKESPRRNVILQAMGYEEDVQVSLGRLRLRRGDRLLLCCDGVFDKVSDDELRDLLAGPDLAAACNRMIDLANERGGDDNLTAIAAHVFGDGLPPPREETVTSTLDVLQDFDAKRSEFGARVARPPIGHPTPGPPGAADKAEPPPAPVPAPEPAAAPAPAPAAAPAPARSPAPAPKPAVAGGPGKARWPLVLAFVLGLAVVGITVWWLRFH